MLKEQAKEEEHNNFISRLACFIYPYAGRCLDGVFRNSVEDIIAYRDYYKSYWVVRNQTELRKTLVSSHGVHQGSTANGKVFYTSPIGLIFVDVEEVLPWHQMNKIDNWEVPSPEWYAESFKRKDFFEYVLDHRVQEIEQYHTQAAKLKIESDIAKRLAETHQKASDLLVKNGYEITDVGIELAIKVMSFDVYYDYSDDHAFCIRYRQYERELRTSLKEEGIEPLLDNFIVETMKKNKTEGN